MANIPLLPFEPSKMTTGAVRERQRELHLCARCNHATVCSVRLGVEAAEKERLWAIAISNCLHFEQEPEVAYRGPEVIR